MMPKGSGWTPFGIWQDMWQNSLRLAEAGIKASETMQASAQVIGSRCRSISEAVRDPLTGDYAELARMVPEKADAFTRAGWAAARNLETMNRAAWTGLMEFGQIATAGRLPTAAELTRLSRRSSRIFACASAAAGKTLSPIHRRATGNARRLKRKNK